MVRVVFAIANLGIAGVLVGAAFERPPVDFATLAGLIAFVGLMVGNAWLLLGGLIDRLAVRD